MKKSKSKQACAKTSKSPCKLTGFLIQCERRDPRDVPKDRSAKAKASVVVRCPPLTDYDLRRLGELPEPTQTLDEIEVDIIDRLFAQFGVNGYRAEDLDGLLVYQDVRDDTLIAQHRRGERFAVYASSVRRIDDGFCITRYGCDLDMTECPSVIATLCLILNDVYRLRYDLVEGSADWRSAVYGMRLMEQLTWIRSDSVYTHLSRPDNIRKKVEAYESYRRKVDIYQQAAERAREEGLSPDNSGAGAVHAWLKSHLESRSEDGRPRQAIPALESIKKDLSHGRRGYGAVPVCVSHAAKPLPNDPTAGMVPVDRPNEAGC